VAGGFTEVIVPIHRSQWPCGLRPGSAAAQFLGLLVRIPPVHGSLSVVIVACFQVEVSATGRSLIQRSPVECDLSDVIKDLHGDGLATLGLSGHEKKNYFPFFHTYHGLVLAYSEIRPQQVMRFKTQGKLLIIYN
jgi:hypothetical protein